MVVAKGDLVYDTFEGIDAGTGIVLEVRSDVEIPPSVSILWSNGIISNGWCDDIAVIRAEVKNERKKIVDSSCNI